MIRPAEGYYFTPTETAIVKILSDGYWHSKHELHTCMGPSSVATLRNHIGGIRRKLRAGLILQAVMLQKGKVGYQLVRPIYSANDGRT